MSLGNSQIIKKGVDQILDSYFKIFDYNQLDVSTFLFIEKKYTKILWLKNGLFFIANSIFLSLIIIILFLNKYPLIFFIISVIAYVALIGFMVLEFFTSKIYNCSKRYYRKQIKILTYYFRNIGLILNNHKVIESLEKETSKKFSKTIYTERLNEIEAGLDKLSNSFKSLRDYLKELGIFTIVVTALYYLFRFIFELLNSQNNTLPRMDINIEQFVFILFIILIAITLILYYSFFGYLRMRKLKRRRMILKKEKDDLNDLLKNFLIKLMNAEFEQDLFPKFEHKTQIETLLTKKEFKKRKKQKRIEKKIEKLKKERLNY